MLAFNIHYGLLENTRCHIQWSEVKRKIPNTIILPHNDRSYEDQYESNMDDKKSTINISKIYRGGYVRCQPI